MDLLFSGNKPQQRCIDYMNKKNYNIMYKYGMFKFGCCDKVSDLITILLKQSPESRHFYENLSKDVKLFTDIELECSAVDIKKKVSPDILEFKQFYLNLILEVIKENCEFYNIPNKVYITDSSGISKNNHKISFHIIISNGFKFHKVCDQMFFWNRICNTILSEEKYIELRKIEESVKGILNETTIFDMSVYSKTQPLRTIYSCKKGSERYLLPIDKDYNELKYGFFNIQNYLASSDNTAMYYNFSSSLLMQPRFKRVFLSDKVSVETIIKTQLPDWDYNTTRNGFIVIKRKSNDIRCVCDKIHSGQEFSYIYKQGSIYYWKCYNTQVRKVLVTVNSHVEDSECKYYYSNFISFFDKQNDMADIYKYFENVFIKLDGMNKTLLARTKNVQYLNNEVSNKKRKIVSYTYEPRDLKNTFSGRNDVCVIVTPDESIIAMKDIDENDEDKPVSVSLGELLTKFLITGKIIRRYKCFDFIPTDNNIELERERIFNRYNGFRLRDQVATKEIPFEQTCMYELILHSLCNGDTRIFNYILNWIAQIIQYPHKKPNTAPFFCSIQGIGKSLFGYFLMNLIGFEYCDINEGSKAFGDFNGDEENKLLIIFEEPCGARMHKQANALKNMITRKTNKINRKFMEKYVQSSFERCIFFGNDPSALRIEPSDRRFLIVKCSHKYRGRYKFFKKIDNEIGDIDVLINAFNWFKTRDISDFNPQQVIETVYKRLEKQSQLCNVYRFIIDLGTSLANKQPIPYIFNQEIFETSTSGVHKYSIKQLHTIYDNWCEYAGENKRYNMSLVKMKLINMDLPFLDRKLYMRGSTYSGFQFTLDELQGLLQIFLQDKEFKFII